MSIDHQGKAMFLNNIRYMGVSLYLLVTDDPLVVVNVEVDYTFHRKTMMGVVCLAITSVVNASHFYVQFL